LGPIAFLVCPNRPIHNIKAGFQRFGTKIQFEQICVASHKSVQRRDRNTIPPPRKVRWWARHVVINIFSIQASK